VKTRRHTFYDCCRRHHDCRDIIRVCRPLFCHLAQSVQMGRGTTRVASSGRASTIRPYCPGLYSARVLPVTRVRMRADAAENGNGITHEDRGFMALALGLARKGKGRTFPNPCVGCVLVKDGEIVGQGYHPKAGMPHAEVYALYMAGDKAAGATAYVTLEPCNHSGRTPPCSQALVDAKVARVVVGMPDPNPLVNSEGIARLRSNGIPVDVMDGDEAQEARDITADFVERITAPASAAGTAPDGKEADGAWGGELSPLPSPQTPHSLTVLTSRRWCIRL